jgi:predicted secreted protein
MSNAIAATGTLLQRGDGATPTENFTTIAEVKDITIDFSGDIIDVTSHDAANSFREKLPTLLDANLTFEVNLLPADATHNPSVGVWSDLLDKVKRNYKVVFTDSGNTEVTLPVHISQFSVNAGVGDALTASITAVGADAPTFA